MREKPMPMVFDRPEVIATHNPQTKPKLYDRDFYAWTQVMAEVLRS
jgi:hypothetical protein